MSKYSKDKSGKFVSKNADTSSGVPNSGKCENACPEKNSSVTDGSNEKKILISILSGDFVYAVQEHHAKLHSARHSIVHYINTVSEFCQKHLATGLHRNFHRNPKELVVSGTGNRIGR